MKKYETVVVFDGSLPEETTAKEQQKVEELIKSNGLLVDIDIWGKKNLAYEIKKKKTGFYSLFLFEYAGDAATLMNDFFRFNENVLRHITLLREDAVIVAPKKQETEDRTNAEDDE